MVLFGTLLSGVLFKKYKPKATYVLGWCVIQDILLALIFLCAMLVSCNPPELQGASGRLNFTEGCNSNCQCLNMKYEPVCNSLKNITYFSPCHAGCSSLSYQNSTKMYSNCSCSPFSQTPLIEAFSVETGPCPVDCTNKEIIYIAIMAAYAFLFGTGRVANVIINY
ncbi:unnamed protein product, partial [Timema podura]|nr:unnamed protein product [Timema podura]